MKAILYALGGIVALCGLLAMVFALNLFGLAQYSFFAPRFQNVQTRVFHETDAYQAGVRMQFQNFREECFRATDDDQRGVIADRIARYADSIPQDLLPADVAGAVRSHKCPQ